MDYLNSILATNLKRLREINKLSLDKVSKLTGVSKSMLGQIERSETNPTISTVWKIANGMKVPFTELIHQSQPETHIIKQDDLTALTEADSKYTLYPFFPYEEGRNFEIYKIVIEEGGQLNAEAHHSNTFEYIIVFEGQLTVKVDKETFVVDANNAIKFKADKTHSYINSGKGNVTINMTIHYDK